VKLRTVNGNGARTGGDAWVVRLALGANAIYRGFTIAVGAEDAVVSGFEMRVGDADREAAAAELREHFASGRLTQDELNERLDPW
jgi:hypothetical protein